MTSTINARNGYRVRRCSRTQWAVLDGEELIMYCERVSMEKYREMMNCTSGVTYEFCECFITVTGEKYKYFRNNDFGIDYIVKIGEVN